MRRRTIGLSLRLRCVLLTGVVLLSVAACAGRSQDGAAIRPIPNGLLHCFVPERECFIRYHPADFSAPIAYVPIPEHPTMASNDGNNMHNDAYMSDVYEASGPLGLNPQILSRTQGFGGYGTVASASTGQLVAVHSNARTFQLELMDPVTLEELASYDLPPRPWYFLLQGVMPWEYIGAGMYFYLDDQDRAVVPTTLNTVQVVQAPTSQGGAFELVREYDLSDAVAPMRWPKQDSVAWVLPEWSGERYWFATTQGVVGVIEVDSGTVRTLRLEGEIIENSFAVGEEGVFIISDRALYRFSRNEEGDIRVDWRTEYDPGSRKKPGVITRGSGASVTLIGGLDGFVAVTDNAEPRIHLLFVRRDDGSVTCSVPLFEEGRSATDITVIGLEHADAQGRSAGVYSAIVENNWGRNIFPFARPAGGVARVDLSRQEGGPPLCEVVWDSNEKNIGVFKLSAGNGLLYLYYKADSFPISKWYLTAVDFATGDTVYRALTGTGLGYNNWAASIFLHPDGGLAYSTTIFGLVAIQDAAP
ncbi:MAG: hypothetical protein GX601_19100 [Anaerolineales bacterium]|nr:hypothetical protein [Anaerolineales bacterium]